VTQIAFYDDPTRCAEMGNKLADELEERIARQEGVFPADAPRILITGTPMAIPNWKLHHIIETAGAAVVVEELCTGTRYFENLVDESATTIEGQVRALAERYMKTNCACFTPNPGRIEDVVRLAKEYNVDGIIDTNLQFCNLYSTESYLVKQKLDELGIPVLHIETDYSENDFEQLRTRVEAFLEILRK
jgi:benzoyl-CoA reductase/2-hydroxyglutaryl-CoA dehydratase subunit BcrC/BadD/HgdB